MGLYHTFPPDPNTNKAFRTVADAQAYFDAHGDDPEDFRRGWIK